MATNRPVSTIQDFLGSAQIFSSAVDDLLTEQMRRVTSADITASQLRVLQLAARAEPQTITDVASFLAVSIAAASKAVDRLVRRGLLRRDESPQDRRAIHLSLTRTGRSVLRKCTGARDRVLAKLFGGRSPEELQRTTELLDQLSLAIVRHDTKHGEICFRCGVFFRDKCLLREASGEICHRHLHLRSKPRIGRPQPVDKKSRKRRPSRTNGGGERT